MQVFDPKDEIHLRKLYDNQGDPEILNAADEIMVILKRLLSDEYGAGLDFDVEVLHDYLNDVMQLEN